MGVFSVERRFAFVHVPKTAGHSLTLALKSHGETFARVAGLKDIACTPQTRIKRVEHARARDIARILGHETWSSLFSFGVVRNPWDRMVSLFHYGRQRPSQARSEELPFKTFECFVLERNRAPRQMSDWLCDDDGQQLVSKVFRFESLENDYPTILKQCSIVDGAPLSHVNASRHQDYRSYYSDHLAEAVADLFATDIERFGYRFDP
jgi:hypothetical protein